MKKTGALLRKVREEKGLSLHEIGLSLKINPKILKQIEDGEQNNLPAKTFLRGFVQSYSIFLKLDSDEVLRIFSEEMGSTKPKKIPTSPGGDSKNSYLPASTPASSSEDKDVGNSRPAALEKKEFELKNFGIGILVIFLLLSLIGIRKIVEKYQKELEVETPKIESEDVANSPPETDANPNPIPVSINNVTLPKENTKPNQPTTATLPPAVAVYPPTSPTPPVPTPTPTPVPAAKVTSPAATTATHTPPVPTPTTKSIPSVHSSSSPPTAPAAAAPAATVPASAGSQAPSKPVSSPPTSPSTPPAAAPTEIKKPTNVDVFIEALDNVDVEVILSSGKAEVFKLLPSQTQRIKTSTGVKINFSNGGAINLIVNGKDLGIPGDLGKPKRVSF